MKSGDIFKGIFSLAVRLLGLFFLYLGLSAVQPLLDLGALETASKSDIITAVLPIVFNLAVGWWLIGGGLLVRRAYPEGSRIFPHPRLQEKEAAPPGPSEATANMDAADKKLASLVETPKENPAASRMV